MVHRVRSVDFDQDDSCDHQRQGRVLEVGERGNALLRRVDRYAGIPLTVPAAALRRLERLLWRISPDRAVVPNRPRVGIFCPAALGDAVLLSALICGIRQEAPGATIDFIGSSANEAVLPLLPHVRGAAFPVGKVGALIGHVRRQHYDVFVDASQWARIGALVAALSGARWTVGFATPGQWRSLPYDLRVPHRRDRHELENFLALGRILWPGLNGRPQLHVPHFLPAADIAKTIFCHMWPAPGPGRALKQWPARHWAALISVLMAHGYEIALTGSKTDAPHCRAFIDMYFAGRNSVRSLAGSVELDELAGSFSRCAAVISVNTGIMHLAAAAGAPTIGLHGATNPLRWGPVGENAVSLLPEKGERAYLHLGFEYPKNARPAMDNLPVAAVLAALHRLGVRFPG